MDLNFINPFIQSAIDIINEFVGIKVRKEEVYVQEGRKSKGGVGIVLDISLDVEGSVIFDFTSEITQTFAKEMIGINISNEEEMLSNKELLESAIMELGNTISGRAITMLEKDKISCDISPPKVYMGMDTMLAADEHIVIAIEFVTDFGGFSLCLTTKDHSYLESVSVLMYQMPEKMKNCVVHHFLPKGFETFNENSIEKINEIISNKKINFTILNTENINDINIINNIKQNSANPDIKIIGFNQKNISLSDEIINELHHQINGALSELEMVKSVSHVLKQHGILPTERRRHIRVVTCKQDNLSISFYMKDKTLLKGIVNDLSVGGAVFRMDKSKEMDKLVIDSRIEGVQIDIEGQLVRTSAIVVFKKNNFIAVRFLDLKKDFIKKVSDYISEKLTAMGGIRD